MRAQRAFARLLCVLALLPLLVSLGAEPTFTDVTATVVPDGLPSGHYLWGDCDGDGDDDLLVSGKTIFINSGRPAFRLDRLSDTGDLAGGAQQRSLWIDIDNDGDLDLFGIGNGDRERLFLNDGACRFTDISDFDGDGTSDLNDASPTMTASTGDYDADGRLDVYVGNYERHCHSEPTEICGDCLTDRLWHNEGDLTFSDATVGAGIYDQEHAITGHCYNHPETPCESDADCIPYPDDSCVAGTCARGSNWVDYDNDGDIDIFVSNYRLHPNLLWENNGDGTFTEVAETRNVDGDEDSGSWGHVLGSDWGDIDNDGDMDLFTANLAHGIWYLAAGHDISQLLISSGAPDFSFTDRRAVSGMRAYDPYSQPDWAETSPAWADYDNDGRLDLYVTHIYGSSADNYSDLYKGNGDGTFVRRTDDYPGLKLYHSYSAAWSDFDQDGDLDLVTYGRETHDSQTSTAHLFRNDGANSSRWLHVRLRGLGATGTNRFAVGARVSVLHDAVSQMREVQGGHGYHTAMNSATQAFGFGEGDDEPVEELRVRWTDGTESVFQDVGMRARVLVFESGVTILSGSDPSALTPLAEDVELFPFTDATPGTIRYYRVDDPRATELLMVDKSDADEAILSFP